MKHKQTKFFLSSLVKSDKIIEEYVMVSTANKIYFEVSQVRHVLRDVKASTQNSIYLKVRR